MAPSKRRSKTAASAAKTKARSRTMDKALERFLRSLYPGVKSARGLQAKQHQSRAVVLVMDQPDLRWLFDAEEGVCRSTILTELGRIEDDEALLEMAREICHRRPKSQEAVAAIRRYRGVRDEPNSQKLAVKLIKTVDAYLKRYPTTTWEQVRAALVHASDVVETAIREPRD